MIRHWIEEQMPVIVEKALQREAGDEPAAFAAPADVSPRPTTRRQKTVYAQEPIMDEASPGQGSLHQSQVVPQSTADLMRPLIAQWIDAQMPVIVEKALQREATAEPVPLPASPAPPYRRKLQQKTNVYAQAPAEKEYIARIRQAQETAALPEKTVKAIRPLMDHWLEDKPHGTGSMPSRQVSKKTSE